MKISQIGWLRRFLILYIHTSNEFEFIYLLTQFKVSLVFEQLDQPWNAEKA